MAKIKGALFSLGASGTVAKVLTFNQSTTRPTARRAPRSSQPATVPQLHFRQQCADAAASWRALPELEKIEWKAVADLTAKNVFAKYLVEWMAQKSSLATPPAIPMR